MALRGYLPFALLALASAACTPATAPPPAPRGAAPTPAAPPAPRWRFPSRAELAAIAPAALRAEAARPDDRGGEGFRFDEASLPGAPSAPSPAALARLVGALGGEGRALTPSPALACAAREFSRFRLANGASPAEGLRRHLLGHCGSPLPAPSYAYVQGEAGAKTSDDELLREALPKLREGLTALPPGAEVGVAIAREGKRVVISTLAGVPAVDLEAETRLGEADDAVTLRGVVRGPAEAVLGLVNQGARGVAACAPAPGVKPPRFELRCPVAVGERTAWVDVVARPPGRPLFDRVAQVLARRPGAPQPYAAAAVGAPGAPRDGVEFAREVLARINAVRRELGARPLELDEAQSASNARLAAPFFNAEIAGDRELAGRIALGLSAGWDVRGPVRRGHFGAFLSPSSDDGSVWLGEALAQPFGRWTFLSPEVQRVALGPAPGKGALGALVTTYALFDEARRGAEADRAFAILRARRAERGLPPPTRFYDPGALRRGIERFERGEPAKQALDGSLVEAQARFGRDVHGAALEADDVGALVVPPALLDRLPPQVAVEVGYRRAPDEAWGRYAVFVVVAPGLVNEAYRRPPGDEYTPPMPDESSLPRLGG
ncbi:MAG TPA: hypothetical protein VFS43_36065 [Polyangiaceae bacterium]|nr:hypothetical protein [Polyangiaceae bacterium]